MITKNSIRRLLLPTPTTERSINNQRSPYRHHIVPQWFLKNWERDGKIKTLKIIQSPSLDSISNNSSKIKKELGGIKKSNSVWTENYYAEYESTLFNGVDRKLLNLFRQLIRGDLTKEDAILFFLCMSLRSNIVTSIRLSGITEIPELHDPPTKDQKKQAHGMIMEGRLISFFMLAAFLDEDSVFKDMLGEDWGKSKEALLGGYGEISYVKSLSRMNMTSVRISEDWLVTSDEPFSYPWFHDSNNEDHYTFNISPNVFCCFHSSNYGEAISQKSERTLSLEANKQALRYAESLICSSEEATIPIFFMERGHPGISDRF